MRNKKNRKMGKILNILLYPIRKQPYLFVFATLMHSIVVVLCATRDLDVHPLCANGFPIIDAYLLCVVATLLQRIRCGWLPMVIYALLTISEIVCVQIYGTLFNAHVVRLILSTHKHEVQELGHAALTNPMTYLAIPTIVAIGALVYGIVVGARKLPTWAKKTAGWTIVFLTFCSACFQVPCYVRCARCFSAPNSDVTSDPYYRPYLYSPIVRTTFAIAFIQAEAKEIKQITQSIQRKTVTDCQPICPMIVVIIGESFNKHRCGLYNPKWKKVNPRLCALSEQGEMVVFDDVVTPSNMTSHVMRSMLSTWTRDCKDTWEEHTLFPVVFREAGYRVALLSNQYSEHPKKLWSIIGGTLFTRPEINNAQFEWFNDSVSTYDEQALGQLPSMEYLSEKPTLLMIHLRGQHVEYNLRYPEEWDIFKAEDMSEQFGGKKAQRISAAYANATLYNDYVVDSIWNMFKHKDAVCIYFSDHGEEVYDWRNFFERSDESQITPEIARYQFEVPMMVMMSDSFQLQHPETAERIRQAASKPTSNEYLAHMLFHLGGIETTEYDPTRDVLSEQFDTTRPRYIGTGFNYDEMMQQWTH